MRASHLLIALAAGAAAFQIWRGDGLSSSVAADVSENGFVAIPLPRGVLADEIVIFAPLHCPRAAGRRADALEAELDRQGISHRRSQHANFAGFNPRYLDDVESVMSGELPIVFVGGRAKANPSPDDVAAEYRVAQAP